MPSKNAPKVSPDEPSENSPLLTPLSERSDPFEALPTILVPRKKPERLTLWFMLIVLLVSLGDQLQESPETRILESVICYRYYEQEDPSKLLVGRDAVGPGAIGGVPEMLCKADEVQSQLALLKGWQLLFISVPSLLLSLPVGWAADRYGRKPFLVAGMAAFVLRAFWVQIVAWFWQAFDIRMTWLSAIFAALGGGSSVTTTLLFVALSDITPEAGRAAVFLRVGAFNLLAALLMPPLAAWLMTFNPWIAALGGTLVMAVATVLLACLPETLDFADDTDTQQTDSGGTARPSMARVKSSAAVMARDWRIPILILPFTVHMLLTGIGGNLVTLQYLSKRYTLTLSRATLLLTIRNGVVVVLLFFVLPFVSTMLTRSYHLSSQRKDIYLTRVSQILLTVGWIAVGLSPNIPLVVISLAVVALGQGSYLLLRSSLTSLLPARHIARVYSFVSVIDTLGYMIDSPLLAALFKEGIALGGVWVGLPYFFIGIVFAIFTLLLFSVRVGKRVAKGVLGRESE